jgi:hypothetical protein
MSFTRYLNYSPLYSFLDSHNSCLSRNIIRKFISRFRYISKSSRSPGDFEIYRNLEMNSYLLIILWVRHEAWDSLFLWLWCKSQIDLSRLLCVVVRGCARLCSCVWLLCSCCAVVWLCGCVWLLCGCVVVRLYMVYTVLIEYAGSCIFFIKIIVWLSSLSSIYIHIWIHIYTISVSVTDSSQAEAAQRPAELF